MDNKITIEERKTIKGIIIGIILIVLARIIGIIIEGLEVTYGELPKGYTIAMVLLYIIGLLLIILRIFKPNWEYGVFKQAGSKIRGSIYGGFGILVLILFRDKSMILLINISIIILFLFTIFLFYRGIYLLHKGFCKLGIDYEDSWMIKACSRSWMFFILTSIASIIVSGFFYYTGQSRSTLTINWVLNGLNIISVILMYCELIRILWHVHKKYGLESIYNNQDKIRLWSFKKLGISLSVLCASLIMAICILGTLAICNYTDKYDFKYKKAEIMSTDDYILLTRYIGDRKEVKVPAEIDGKKVIGMESHTFQEDSNVEKIVIEDGIKEIEDKAFYRCSKLETIVFPGSITSIGVESFYGTSWFENQINNKTSDFIIIGDGILLLYNGNSEEVIVPEDVKIIGNKAFDYYSGIRRDYFRGSNIKKVILPESITRIGDYAFKNCKKLKEINFANGLKYIGESAFWHCDDLKEITLPRSIRKIEDYAFSGCSNLGSVKIPKGVGKIDTNAFYLTPWLENSTEEFLVVGDGNLIKYNGQTGSDKDIVIPDGIKRMKGSIFEDHEVFHSITIPESVEGINCRSWGVKVDEIIILGSNTTIQCIDDKYDGLLIGRKDSEAERYAKENDIDFEVLD
ncbi:MAG: leucine-rich repeat domain-containing protein [Eubacteriales bacterium]